MHPSDPAPLSIMTTTPPSLTLYRGFPISNTFTWSPFVTKLEARLRFSSLSYTLAAGSPLQGPRGQIPYIGLPSEQSSIPTTITTSSSNKHSLQTLLGDSTIITSNLISTGQLDDLNAHLTPAQKASDLALRALLQDRLYMLTEHEKWSCGGQTNPATKGLNFYVERDHVLAPISWPLRVVVGMLAWRWNWFKLYAVGAGRLTGEERRLAVEEGWDAVAGLLRESWDRKGEKVGEPFWMLGGEGPTECDATVFGFVVCGLVCES